jgi:hypothetical protein
MNNDFRHPPELLVPGSLWVVTHLTDPVFQVVPNLSKTYAKLVGKTVKLHDLNTPEIEYLAVYLADQPKGRLYAFRHDELQPVTAFQEIEESLWV